MQPLIRPIVSSLTVLALCLTIADAQQPSPVVTFEGHKMQEKTTCFQLAPLELRADIVVPAEAEMLYITINWAGGSSSLHVSLQANELRRPKAQWEGESPLEKTIKMGGETNMQWYLKLHNLSNTSPAYGCCVMYYTVKQKIKNDMVFDGQNLQIDTGKITYAMLLDIDKSSWGDGTLKMMSDGEVGILYPNGNYIKNTKGMHMVLGVGDSIYNVYQRNLSPLLNQVPAASPPPSPSAFKSDKDQAWLMLLSNWIEYTNSKLYKTSLSLIEKSGLKTDLNLTQVKEQIQKEEGMFSLHNFLINTILIVITNPADLTAKNN